MARGRSPLREPTGPWEFLLGLLAVVSLGIFFAPHLATIHLALPDTWQPYLIALDVAICVVFALDYVTRMLRSPDKPLSFARQNVFQPFAMIPLNTPLVSEVQILLLFIVFSRFVRAFNVVFGQRAFQAILSRYSGILAREISDAVLVRSLNTAKEITDRGRFAESIGDSLDRRRVDVTAIVHDTLSRHPSWYSIKRLPGISDLISRVETLAVDTIIETLRSDRMNHLIGEVINDSIDDFKTALERRHPGVTADALGQDAAGRMP